MILATRDQAGILDQSPQQVAQLRATELRRACAELEQLMKKMLSIPLEDAEIIELCRILIDKDAAGALEFLQTHVKGKARDLLEGG